jgi:tryptophanyl-tRNA synthetase
MIENSLTSSRARVLSGMRPTGRLHLGNYMGALYNWVKLQHQYECYFFIADWHALTTDYADPSRIQQNTLDVALDFLAAGLNPEQCTIFVQSHVPQHAELNLLFSMFTPLSWLERVPSYKDQQAQLREKELNTYGFLGYPLLQSADILLYEPDFVPVGEDQVAHVELTREVARRFNSIYGEKTESPSTSPHGSGHSAQQLLWRLKEPQVKLTSSPKLPGIDGRKMSKSYGNTIMLTDQPPVVRSKMESMSNGGQRFVQSDPGDPDSCPVGDMHKVFSSADKVAYIQNGCRSATIGCLTCKQLASDSIVQMLGPIQNERFRLEADLFTVGQILEKGAQKASARANLTIGNVRSAMGLSKYVAGARIERHMERVYRAIGSSTIYNLAAHQHWWDLDDDALRASLLQSYWLDHIVPRDIVLKRDSDRVFITSNKKRVFVTTSREAPIGVWSFHAKPKSYEMLTLLCWEKNSKLLYGFVVPQKVYVDGWSHFKKENKNIDIHFQVFKIGDEFTFRLENSEPVNITEFLGKYEPMQ